MGEFDKDTFVQVVLLTGSIHVLNLNLLIFVSSLTKNQVNSMKGILSKEYLQSLLCFVIFNVITFCQTWDECLILQHMCHEIKTYQSIVHSTENFNQLQPFLTFVACLCKGTAFSPTPSWTNSLILVFPGIDYL